MKLLTQQVEDINPGQSTSSTRRETTSWTYLFYTYGDYNMATNMATVLSPVHAICLSMTTAMAAVYRITTKVMRGPKASCSRKYHRR